MDSEKIRQTNENQRMNGKLSLEDIKSKAAIQQRDEAFEHVCKLHDLIMEADLELDTTQSKVTVEVGKYIKNFRYHSDQPKNLAQKV